MERNKEEEVAIIGFPVKKDDVSGSTLDTKQSDPKIPQVKIVRGSKKLRIDPTESTQCQEKKEIKEDDGEAKIVRSLKRSCELWSMEDKNTFFKAVNDSGRDFDALHSYFLNQGKKKGISENMIKNKEQIRHFYYRTWLKISKHLKFSDEVKKASQEIYGLINYGELRRKLPRIHEKVLLKLNELVYWGSTQVRLRGKTMRIKTPICRALRKLNQLEDWQEEIKLPSRLTIELRPGDNLTWWKVQTHALNPRVRTLLPIQRRLSSLLSFLQQRWKPAKIRTSVNDSGTVGDLREHELLRVAPPDSCKITLPIVNLGEYLTSNSVSFNSYEQRLGLKSSRVELLGSEQQLKNVGKKAIKKKNDKRQCQSRSEDNGDKECTEVDVVENSIPILTEKCQNEVWTEPNRFPGRETVDRIRRGWNIDEANTITIGDLYLMFGRDSKITLEYWWDVAQSSNNVSPNEESIRTKRNQDSSTFFALQKLLSIAKHNYGSSKVFDNTSSSNETVISSRVPSTKESTFRRPLIPQVYHKMGSQEAFKTQLDKFTSRFYKRGRNVRQRNLIVQRTVPIIETVCQEMREEVNQTLNLSGEVVTATEESQSHVLATNEPGNHFHPSDSIITTATQILKEGEGQWLNSEVADYSLSSFLGQFESPVKGSRSQIENHEDIAQPSSDVVSQMQCLMVENSVDYMAKFATLASQIASDEHGK